MNLALPRVLRDMRAEDLPEVAAIEKASFSLPWSLSMFAHELEQPLRWMRVAVDLEGRVAGYIVCRFYGDIWHLMNVAVREEDRRRGLGSRLLDEFLMEVSAAGIDVMLEVRPSNTGAITLYRSRGFEDSGRRPRYYHDNDEDALVMFRKGRRLR